MIHGKEGDGLIYVVNLVNLPSQLPRRASEGESNVNRLEVVESLRKGLKQQFFLKLLKFI